MRANGAPEASMRSVRDRHSAETVLDLKPDVLGFTPDTNFGLLATAPDLLSSWTSLSRN